MDLQAWVEKAYNVLHKPYTSGLNYGIPEHWLAGLVYVECASLDPKAHRPEGHVIRAIQDAKRGIFNKAFPGFSSGELGHYIQGTSNPNDLEALGTSYGLGQIMGYHYYSKWGLLPQQFKNLSVKDSVKYTLRFMSGNMKYTQVYSEILHLHNTGSLSIPTYDPQYIPRAQDASEVYKKYLVSMTPKT